MDDLDHSIHIVEYEWMSFYEESEECSLLLPSIAGIENYSLSDSEDSLSLEYSSIERETCESPQDTAAKIYTFGENALRPIVETEHCPSFAKALQVNQSSTGIQPDENNAGLKHSLESLKNTETCPEYSGENVRDANEVRQTGEVREMTNNITDKHQLSDLQRKNGVMQSGNVRCSMGEPKPLTGHQAEVDVNDKQKQCTHNVERTLCEKESRFSFRREKERWFVTVNVSPLRRKRRRKKNCQRINRFCRGLQEPSLECGSKIQKYKGNEFERGKDFEHFILSPILEPPTSAVSPHNIQTDILAESKQMHVHSSLLDTKGSLLQTPEKLVFSEATPQSVHLPNAALSDTLKGENITPLDSVECADFKNAKEFSLAIICNSQQIPTVTLSDAFTLKTKSMTSLDRMDSTEFETAEECSSTKGSDSESYTSATDTIEDPQHLCKDRHPENKPEVEDQSQQSTLLLTISDGLFESSETTNVPNTNDTTMYPRDIQLAHATNLSHVCDSPQEPSPLERDGCKNNANRGYTESAMTSPAGQHYGMMPYNNSTSDNDALHSMSHVSLDETQELQNKSPSDFNNDQLQPSAHAVPLCPSAVGPEAFTESFGPSQPVYTMSAFWDDMEKLTIRDILQLKMSGGQYTQEAPHIQETARPQVDVPDMQTCTGSGNGNVECLCPASALVETSDTADSTSSDFDEEFWQLLGTSRDTSPDLQDNKQSQRAAVSSSTQVLVENTMPVSRTTVEQVYDEPHSLNSCLLSQTVRMGGLQKSKSMHNVQALKNSHEDRPLKSILENVDNSLLHLNSLSMEKIPLIKVNDSTMLIERTLSTILSNTDILDENYRISFPDVFEYLFEENETENDCRTVSVYDDSSVTALYGFTQSQYRSESSLLSIQDSQCIEEKPVPIFTCSRPSVSYLTFPDLDYLIFQKETHEESETMSDRLSVHAASGDHTQAVDYVSSAAAPDGTLLFNNKGWSCHWNRWFSIRGIRFPDSGSSWWRRSGAWVFPVGVQRTPIKRASDVTTMSTQRRFASLPLQLFTELAAEQQVLKNMKTTVSLSEKEGFFSTLKQSDMCLVCIAIASWVLRSTDPQAADSWKAALLANVSAISAIQYLRHVLKDPSREEP